MFWRCLQTSLAALHFKILVNIYSVQIQQSPLQQWLPLPYNVHSVSIEALKCYSNFTQKPFEIMLKLKTGSFFFLSIYLFPSGELFLYEKVPKMKCFYPFPARLWSTPKAREHSEWKNYRTSKIAVHWCLFFSLQIVKSEPQTKKNGRNSHWSQAKLHYLARWWMEKL